MKRLWMLLFFLCLTLIMCGHGHAQTRFLGTYTGTDAPLTITASQVFVVPSAPSSWRFAGHNGCQTSITIWLPQPTNYIPAGSFIWSYDKNGADCYWQPGVADAHLDFVFGPPAADGAMYSIASLITFPHSCIFCSGGWTELTVDVQPVGNEPRPYLYIPAAGTLGRTQIIDTDYYGYGQPGIITGDSVIGSTLPPTTHWRNAITVEWIDAPPGVSWSSGYALTNEQWEGPCFLPDGSYFAAPSCNHEKVYFMPGLGMVFNRVYAGGSGEIVDGRYDMWRVN